MQPSPLTPAAFLEAWAAADLVQLPPSDAEQAPIPPDAHAFLVRAGLPRRLSFTGLLSQWEFSFERLACGLTLIADDLECLRDPAMVWSSDDAPDGDWENYWLIGEENFGVGDAVSCVHGPTGHVLRIDIELPEPITFMNASVAHLAASLLVVRNWSFTCARGEAEWPAELQRLEHEFRQYDPEAMVPGAFWEGMLAMLREEGAQGRDFRVAAG